VRLRRRRRVWRSGVEIRSQRNVILDSSEDFALEQIEAFNPPSIISSVPSPPNYHSRPDTHYTYSQTNPTLPHPSSLPNHTLVPYSVHDIASQNLTAHPQPQPLLTQSSPPRGTPFLKHSPHPHPLSPNNSAALPKTLFPSPQTQPNHPTPPHSSTLHPHPLIKRRTYSRSLSLTVKGCGNQLGTFQGSVQPGSSLRLSVWQRGGGEDVVCDLDTVGGAVSGVGAGEGL